MGDRTVTVCADCFQFGSDHPGRCPNREPPRERPEPGWWVCTTCCTLALHALAAGDDTCAECTQPLTPAYRDPPTDHRCPLCAEPLDVSCPRGHWGAPSRMVEAVREALRLLGEGLRKTDAGDWPHAFMVDARDALSRALKGEE